MIHSSQHTEGLPSDQKEQNTQEEATRQVRFHGVPEGSREIAQMSLALLDPQLYDKVKEYRKRLVTNGLFEFLMNFTCRVKQPVVLMLYNWFICY